jgi:hypothetical protein
LGWNRGSDHLAVLRAASPAQPKTPSPLLDAGGHVRQDAYVLPAVLAEDRCRSPQFHVSIMQLLPKNIDGEDRRGEASI